MKFYFRMPNQIKEYYLNEVAQFESHLRVNSFQQAWHHLERAHILGQQYPLEHSHIHLKMLGFGIRIKDAREIIGQIPRLIFGGVKSFVGQVPIGNPGSARVPALKAFPLDKDLKDILQNTSK